VPRFAGAGPGLLHPDGVLGGAVRGPRDLPRDARAADVPAPLGQKRLGGDRPGARGGGARVDAAAGEPARGTIGTRSRTAGGLTGRVDLEGWISLAPGGGGAFSYAKLAWGRINGGAPGGAPAGLARPPRRVGCAPNPGEEHRHDRGPRLHDLQQRAVWP